MVQLPGAPPWLQVCSAADEPELWQRVHAERLFDRVWPLYNLQGDQTTRYFGALFPRYAGLQFLFIDRRSERPVARGRTIPFRWEGTLEDLPRGIDAVGLRAIEERDRPNTLSALAAEIDPDYQGRKLSGLLILAMAAVAREAGLGPLVAPLRPSAKDRYPTIPIERYAMWRRHDGLPWDPWMRVHARLGARVLRAEPTSLRITAPVAEWETWTQMAFPDDGEYVFPGGLAPLRVRDGRGRYFEPAVWMRHDI
jgi:GNAT superfamily N-acetyltransferase